MRSSGVSVKVIQDDENIYEDYCDYSDVNDMNDVTLNIRRMQRKINDFLTQLLQESKTSTDKKSNDLFLSKIIDRLYFDFYTFVRSFVRLFYLFIYLFSLSLNCYFV